MQTIFCIILIIFDTIFCRIFPLIQSVFCITCINLPQYREKERRILKNYLKFYVDCFGVLFHFERAVILFDFKFLAELIASAPHHMLRRIHTLRCTENTPIYGLCG